LVGNKTDVEAREISDAQAREFAGRHDLDYIETSAKDGTGIEEAFVRLASRISDKVTRGEISAPVSPRPDQSNLQSVRNQAEQKKEEPCAC
jgi:50S ribosomal subunit-associated GTPase HflX